MLWADPCQQRSRGHTSGRDAAARVAIVLPKLYLSCALRAFDTFSDVLSSLVRNLERHVGHSAAAVESTPYGIAHQIGLNGCHVLRRSAAPEFVHSVYARFELLSKE